MIRLGLIGVANPEFREVYLPVLEQLKQKIRVSVIYDSASKRAEMAAACCEAEVCLSFEKLIHRPDVDAVLMLTPAWYGVIPLVSCMELRKPTLCTKAIWQDCTVAEELDVLAQQTDSLLVIESQYRYWPSSLRARELQATELGAPRRVECTFPDALDRECLRENPVLADLLDWGRFLLQRSQTQSEPVQTPDQLTINFVRQRSGQILDSIPFVLKPAQTGTEPVLSMECESGVIRIYGPHHLEWECQSTAAGTPQKEDLNEQTGILRQIDHFCRRVAGGLIPVHDLADALWSQRTAKSVVEQLT